MGPIALFDKSFIQSLSLDEAVLFDDFFLPVICPLFYVETLADLEKHVREGRTPEQEVGIIADKVPEMGGYPCAYHTRARSDKHVQKPRKPTFTAVTRVQIPSGTGLLIRSDYVIYQFRRPQVAEKVSN